MCGCRGWTRAYSFLKTRNTDKLLQESRRRRDEAASVPSAPQSVAVPSAQDNSLANLVATVKRKSEARGPGQGKRQKR
jgi:hypothetical protein